jgi:hypothetical protein
MSRGNAWARHYQSVWQERAARRNLPNWLRVAALAYGAHAANGHALFKPGDLAVALGEPGRPMNKHNVQRAIKTAVDNGWLSSLSGSTCLVVPAHAITGGMGRPGQLCPVHGGPPKVSHSVTHPRPEGESLSDYLVSHSVPTDKPLTCGNVTALYDSSLGLSQRTQDEAAS